jgi:transcriptional regulator with PAS, ATPase and Fis domain
MTSIRGANPEMMDLSREGQESASSGHAPPAARIELLEAMVEGAREGLCILDRRSILLHSNEVGGELLSFHPRQAVGRPVYELGVSSDFDWSIGGDALASGVAVSAIQTLRSGRKLLVSAVPVSAGEGDAKRSYVVVTMREVTDMGQVMTRLRDAVELVEQSRSTLSVPTAREQPVDEVLAHSPGLAAVRETARQYAAVDATVLVLGETGAGKGVFARLIHQASGRSGGPFLEVNCGAIPEGLMEAELFGYAKGAFTGADAKGKAGLVEMAHKGTLLLNEIGDLPLSLQVKLLRFLEDGEVWAVGAVKPKRPDVRIIAATNRNLARMVADGRFREDLFYRIDVLALEIPALRDHPEDIPGLVRMALAKAEKRLRRRRAISPEALAILTRYRFPGNVRELLNLVERLVVTAASDTVDVADLPVHVRRAAGHDEDAGSGPAPGAALRKRLKKMESELLREALVRFKTQAEAARHLGVAQSTVARKAKQYGLRIDDSPRAS